MPEGFMNDPGPLELHKGPTPPTTDRHGGSFICMYLFLYSYSSPPPSSLYGLVNLLPSQAFCFRDCVGLFRNPLPLGEKKEKKNPPHWRTGLITVILRLVTGFLPVFATFHAFFFFLSSSFSDALPSPFFLFFWGFIKA